MPVVPHPELVVSLHWPPTSLLPKRMLPLILAVREDG
jgi:hypothetical protein